MYYGREEEAESIVALAQRFPQARLTLGSRRLPGLLNEAIKIGKYLKGSLAYAEDPCGAEQGFSGREVMASSVAQLACQPQPI